MRPVLHSVRQQAGRVRWVVRRHAGMSGTTDERPRRGRLRRWLRWRTALHLVEIAVPLLILLYAWALGAGVSRENGVLVARLVGPPPCDDARSKCLTPSEELIAKYADGDACAPTRVDVCLVLLGKVDPLLIESLIERYRHDLNLRLGVLPPRAVPRDLLDEDRGQYPGVALHTWVFEEYRELAINRVATIALTPVDIYFETRPNWRFAFGLSGQATSGAMLSLVSTHRMLAEEWGIWRGAIPVVFRYGYDEGLVTERASRMVTKYLGIHYFEMPLSDDPSSPLYNNILSVLDLDAMGRHLPSTALHPE
jgi:hypothetical protein